MCETVSCVFVAISVPVAIRQTDRQTATYATSRHVLQAHPKACTGTMQGKSVSFKHKMSEVFIVSDVLQGKGDGM